MRTETQRQSLGKVLTGSLESLGEFLGGDEIWRLRETEFGG